jgi:hypothetical protein
MKLLLRGVDAARDTLRRSGACPCVSGAAAWTGVTVGVEPLRSELGDDAA